MSDDIVKALETMDWDDIHSRPSAAGLLMEEAAAEITRLRAELAAARREGMEEAAKIADGYHQRAIAWAKKVRGLEKYIDETDSSRIAATIRAAAKEVKP